MLPIILALLILAACVVLSTIFTALAGYIVFVSIGLLIVLAPFLAEALAQHSAVENFFANNHGRWGTSFVFGGLVIAVIAASLLCIGVYKMTYSAITGIGHGDPENPLRVAEILPGDDGYVISRRGDFIQFPVGVTLYVKKVLAVTGNRYAELVCVFDSNGGGSGGAKNDDGKVSGKSGEKKLIVRIKNFENVGSSWSCRNDVQQFVRDLTAIYEGKAKTLSKPYALCISEEVRTRIDDYAANGRLCWANWMGVTNGKLVLIADGTTMMLTRALQPDSENVAVQTLP